MEYRITELIMLLMALISGVIVSVIRYGKIESKKRVLLIGMLYSHFEFWILNAFRMILLRGNIVCSYWQDCYLLLFDIVLTLVGMVVTLKYLPKWSVTEKKWFWGTEGLLLSICYISCFAFNYAHCKDIKLSVYYLQMPYKVFICGMIAIMFYCACVILSDRKVWKHVWYTQRGTGLVVAVFFIITVFLYPSMETYLTNAGEFSFTIKQIRWNILFYIGLISLIGVITFLCVRKRAYFSFCIWSISICAYIQGMLLNDRFSMMDGARIDFGNKLKLTNLAIWGILIAVLYIVWYKVVKNREKLLILSSALLTAMQLVGLISLVPYCVGSLGGKIPGQEYLSDIGLHEVAEENNIIIFVLDKYDVSFMEEVLVDDPDFLKPLRGFTYFPDTVSQFSRTFPAIPYMLTGKEYYYETSKEDYVNAAYKDCLFWDGLEEKGYNIYLYEDSEYIGDTVLLKAKNYVEEGQILEEKLSFGGYTLAMNTISAYRVLPYALKIYYSYTAESIDELVVTERKLKYSLYKNNDDSIIYEEFRQNGLEATPEKRAFRLIHLMGAHPPYTLTEDGRKADSWESDAMAQYKGSMNLVFDYLRLLEGLGLYDKSTIIITADHGDFIDKPQLEKNTNPILFIKPYGIGNENDLQISDIYASQNDLLPTISAICGINYNTSNGLNLMDTQGEDKKRIRYYNFAVFENLTQTKTRTYEIRGSSLDFQNWYATDEYHEIKK